MKTIAISKFKATCLGVLEEVNRTGEPVLVTRFGKPVAQVVPPAPPERPKDWIGMLSGTAEIKGDIVSPVLSPEEWGELGR
jgi:prevent-host-death family protein